MKKTKNGLVSKSGKKCQLSGLKATRGWRYSFLRSHFNPTSLRRFEVNLQTVKTFDEKGTPIRIKVSTKVLKRCIDLKKKGVGISAYTQRHKEKRLKGKAKRQMLESLQQTSSE